MEDLTGSIQRVCDGLADEAANRVSADLSGEQIDIHSVVYRHVRQVLIDWFLGEFIPGR